MGLLIFVTVLWAFSFSLIGEFLAGLRASQWRAVPVMLAGIGAISLFWVVQRAPLS